MESIHLVGAEEVARAGRTMAQAAAEMQHAASRIEYALQHFASQMETWLARLEELQHGPPPTNLP